MPGARAQSRVWGALHWPQTALCERQCSSYYSLLRSELCNHLTVPLLLQGAPVLLQSQVPGWAAPMGACGNVHPGTRVLREDVVYTCFTWVLTAPQGLLISLAIKLHMDLLSMICGSQQVDLMTQQLAEETQLLLLLGPPNMLRETAPSEGHQLDHNGLLQSNKSRLARADWRLSDLFINLSSLAECCPQSSPAAPALELPKHPFPILVPRSGLHPQITAGPWLPQQGGHELGCEGQKQALHGPGSAPAPAPGPKEPLSPRAAQGNTRHPSAGSG